MKKINESKGDKVFETAIAILLLVFGIATLYPFWHLITLSITASTVPLSRIYFFPPAVDIISYKMVFHLPAIWIGYKNTLFRVILGTSMTVLITMMMAYPLSKKDFPNKNFWTLLIVFTMYFSGGLIPTYLLVSNTLNLTNTIWALTLPSLVNAFNMIIARNFIGSIPTELEESAKIDGASAIRIFVRIIMPLSKPIITTLILWTAVWLWNEWFSALLYITDDTKMVLQVVMRRVVMQTSTNFEEIMEKEASTGIRPENVKAATVIISTVPILAVYPFVQKYFIKGVMIGSLKG
jgi:putative aldouronate transport system permease protein